MRIQHKPRNTIQVDWIGNTVPLHNRYTDNFTELDLRLIIAFGLPHKTRTLIHKNQNFGDSFTPLSFS